MSGIAPTPQHGAALRWFYERFDVGSCSTQDHMSKARELVAKAKAFAADQPADVRWAYEWAAATFLHDCGARFDAYDNSRRVAAAYAGLPKPPDEEKQA